MTVADEIQYGVESIRRGRDKLIRAWRLGGFATAESYETITLSRMIDDLTGLTHELERLKASLVENVPSDMRRAS